MEACGEDLPVSEWFQGWALDPGTLGFELPFVSYVRAAARAGFAWVEVPVMELSSFGSPQALQEFFMLHQVRPGIFSCPWQLPANASVPDLLFETRLRDLPQLCEAVRQAGGTRVSVFFNSSRPNMAALSFEQIVGRCRSLAEITAAAGLQLCVELNDPAYLRLAQEILEAAGRPPEQLALLFDCFHMFRSSLGLDWMRDLPAGSIGWIHLSDVPRGVAPQDCDSGPRTVPASGQLDLPAILQEIVRIGYRGPLSLEILEDGATERDPDQRAVALLEQTRAALAAVVLTPPRCLKARPAA